MLKTTKKLKWLKVEYFFFVVTRYPQPGSVFKKLDPNGLKLLENFHWKTNSIPLRTVDLCLEMSSDFKYYFGFVVGQIFELGHTVKSRWVDT